MTNKKSKGNSDRQGESGMAGSRWKACAILALASTICAAQKIVIRDAPDASAKPYTFRDGRFHVRFMVPPGWQFTTRDGEVSAFHADVTTAPRRSSVRGVASLDFNPYPRSTLSGAMFYFSVDPKTTRQECAGQATPTLGSQEIGGMSFAHGHEEHGVICTEARDDVYTAYRKNSCYRFDLKVNTFCAVSSGALEITESQLQDIEQRMTGILSTVDLGWEKSRPNFVPAPALPPPPVIAPTPTAQPPSGLRVQPSSKTAVSTGQGEG
jgi:hypothetical protein